MLSFADATGNLFNRLGKLGYVIKELMTYQANQLNNITNTTYGATAQYNGESDLQALLGGSYIGQLNGPGSSIGALVTNLAQLTINRMVFRDNPRISQNLQTLNLSASIEEVIRQMKIAGASILAQTIAATPSDAGDGGDFTGNGNGVIVTSTQRPVDGLILQNAFAETLLLTCISDSYSGSATEGNEGFTVTGEGNQSNVWAFDWPLGSNCQFSVSAIDGNADNSSGNLLTNSGFESWTGDANEPDSWVIVVGDAGTNFFEENTIVYDGDASLLLVGDADGTLCELWQEFDNADEGTAGTLDPLTQYAFNCFLKRGGTALEGTLLVELVDDAGAVVQDESGANNAISFNLANVTTDWASFSGTWRTPAIMPDTYHIRFRLSVAIPNGRQLYIDKAALGAMTQSYTSGTYCAVFAGSSPFVIGDYGTITVTNSRGAAGTLSTFATVLQRLCFTSIMNNEYILPYSATPTISDGLIAYN